MKEKIRLASVHVETPMEICEEYVQLLIVENAREFYKTVLDLEGAFEGKTGEFVFSRAGETILVEKYGAMVSDIFHFDLNDKKIVNLLYKRLESIAFGEKVRFFHELSSGVVAFLEELSFCVPFALSYEEPQPVEYLKAAGLKFEKTYDSLLEKIVCYINALIELKKCEFFVFVNLKSVLDDEELLKLYAHCRNEEVGLLLLENTKKRAVLSCEKAVIITEDLCEIVENYNDLW